MASTFAAPAWNWWKGLEIENLEGERMQVEESWIVVVFLSEECPVSNEYLPVLNRLSEDFRKKGFRIIGAYCDPQAELESMREHRAAYDLNFHLADDRSQKLVDYCQAQYTPEAFVVGSGGSILYRGRIDNRVGGFGTSRPKATRRDLRQAMEGLASGQSGPFESTKGFGCAIPEKVR